MELNKRNARSRRVDDDNDGDADDGNDDDVRNNWRRFEIMSKCDKIKTIKSKFREIIALV